MNGLWFERSEDEVRGVLRLVEADPQVVQVVHLGEVGQAPVGRLLGRGDEDHGEEGDERHALADELHTRVPQEAARLQHNNHHGGDIWLYGAIQIAREETRCRHMGYSFRLTARVLLYAPSHRQDTTYHGL